jgi:hypothetical protein
VAHNATRRFRQQDDSGFLSFHANFPEENFGHRFGAKTFAGYIESFKDRKRLAVASLAASHDRCSSAKASCLE